MKIEKTKFKGLLIFESKKFNDNRGYFRELGIEKIINKKLIFSIVSKSKKNVLRGLHMQKNKQQGKYVSVVKGEILDVVVDCRKNSKTFGQYFSIILSERKNNSLFIPEGFAHGFCSLSEYSLLHYKMTNYRFKNMEKGILWNDKEINIKWPINKPIISNKDKKTEITINWDDEYLKINWNIKSPILSKKDKNGFKFKDIFF